MSFDAGWYGAIRMCQIAFLVQNSCNSSAANCGRLSATINSGTLNLENSVRSLWTVVSAVAVFIRMTSTTEWASTTMHSSGPAKSTWSRDHGLVGQLHGCIGADVGNGCVC